MCAASLLSTIWNLKANHNSENTKAILPDLFIVNEDVLKFIYLEEYKGLGKHLTS